jgi:hypothetical protein
MTLEARTVVFIGPSLPERARPRIDDGVIWYPPAGRGDLAALDLPPGSRVILIDGYLIQQHPPSPTEVFGLIERGSEVWGCSSLGALRAAELRHHGVQGHGWVYDRVVDGTITYDDEVVAPLDPRTGEAAGLFLANIRFGLERLVAGGRTTERHAQHLIATLRDVHFEQRTVSRCHDLAMDAGLDPAAITDVLRSDVKRHDAETLIRRLTTPVAAP